MAALAGAVAFLARFGYALVFLAGAGEALPFIGLFIPGQLTIILAALAASRGALSVSTVFLVAFAAGIVGDGVGYALGRTRGRALLERYGPRFRIGPSHLARAEALIERYGPVAIVLARFSFVTRGLGPFAAGIARMRPLRFWPLNVLGAALWAGVLVALGYTLGAAFLLLEATVGRVVAVALIVVGLVLLLARALRKLEGGLTRSDRAAVACASAATLLFALLALRAAAPGPAAPFDDGFDAFRAAAAPFAPLWHLLTLVFLPIVVAPILLALVVVAAARREPWVAFVYVVGLGVGDLIVRLLKDLFARPRPLGAAPIESLSFPSGHAAAAMVAFGATVYFLARRVRSDRARIGLAVAGAVLAALTGLARVSLADHYPTDVLGGYLIGAAWLLVILLIAEWGIRSRPAALAEDAPVLPMTLGQDTK